MLVLERGKRGNAAGSVVDAQKNCPLINALFKS
jgi:hypothetical protein